MKCLRFTQYVAPLVVLLLASGGFALVSLIYSKCVPAHSLLQMHAYPAARYMLLQILGGEHPFCRMYVWTVVLALAAQSL